MLYVIIIERERGVMECVGPFDTKKIAEKVLNEEPSRFGAEDDCLDAYVLPLNPLLAIYLETRLSESK